MKQYLFAVATTVASIVFTCAHAQTAPPNTNYREAKVRDNAFIKAPIPAWIAPAAIPESKLTGPIVVRLSETHFLTENIPQVFIRKVMQFNSANVLNEFGQLPLEFAPEYQTLTLHSLRIIRNGVAVDKRETSPVRFLQREAGLEQGIYSGTVTASILLDDLRVGDLAEVAYTVTGANPVFGNKYFATASWSQQYPTELRRVVLQHPSNRNIRHKFITSNPADPTPSPVQTRHGSMTRLKFDYPQAPATILESDTPVGYNAVGTIQFSEFDSWSEVVTWATALFSESVPMSGEFAQQVARLQSESDEEQKIIKALQYVQNEIRYFSVALGESSHRPAVPSVTIQRRFGDCKDKSFLLISLLRKLGIAADPVLVSSARRNNLQVLLPSPSAFDHVVVRVQHKGKNYFLDPTRSNQASRLETMGQELVDAEVLLINPKTTALTVIPDTQTLADKATSALQETMTVADFEKPAKLTRHFVLLGRDAEYHRHISKRYPEQYAKFIASDPIQRYPGARRIGEPEFKDSPEDNRFEVIEHYTIDNAGEIEGGIWALRYEPSNMKGLLKRPDSVDRNTPLALSLYPIRAKYSFELHLPEHISAMVDPHTRSVNNNHFTFQTTVRFRGNVVSAVMDLHIVRTSIPAADIKDYIKDLRETNNQSSRHVRIPEKWFKPAARRPSGKNDFASRLRTKMEEEIKTYTQVIKNGKISGKDLALVFRERAISYDSSNQTAEAIPDIQEATRLDSSNPDIRLTAGIVYRNNGDYQISLDQLNKALSLGANPETVYINRGETYYYMGKYDNALAELERVVTPSKPNGTQSYAMIWYLRILNHAGKPIPPTMKTFAMQSDSTWPHQVFGLFTGTSTPEKILEDVYRMKGDEREMALCEAYFFIGDYYLQKKDKTLAMKYFMKSRATGVMNYAEYIAAGIELTRMGDK